MDVHRCGQAGTPPGGSKEVPVGAGRGRDVPSARLSPACAPPHSLQPPPAPRPKPNTKCPPPHTQRHDVRLGPQFRHRHPRAAGRRRARAGLCGGPGAPCRRLCVRPAPALACGEERGLGVPCVRPRIWGGGAGAPRPASALCVVGQGDSEAGGKIRSRAAAHVAPSACAPTAGLHLQLGGQPRVGGRAALAGRGALGCGPGGAVHGGWGGGAPGSREA